MGLSEGAWDHAFPLPRRRAALPLDAWLFPDLEPYEPPGRGVPDRLAYLDELAGSLVESQADRADAELDHPCLPAAYAWLASLVERELRAGLDPFQEGGGRPPRLDLAGVYGGETDQPYLYDREDGARLLVEMPHGPSGELDLPRNAQGRALIGEPRHDDFLVTGQLHLALVRFHNRIVDRVRRHRGGSPAAHLREAQRLVRWHVQWVVLRDFLPRLVGEELVAALWPRRGESATARLSVFGASRDVLPLEFALGGALALWSLHRSAYDLSDFVAGRPVRAGASCESSPGDLRGGRMLPAGCSVQWDRFLPIEGSVPQRCRRLNTHLPAWVHDPAAEGGSLLLNALVEGWRCGLPSGQDVARSLGLPPVRAGRDPLLVYVLSEAEDPPHDGARLVGVGARILAEVLIGVVAADPGSFLRREPSWAPELSSTGGGFDLVDLLRLSGMPLASADLQAWSGHDLTPAGALSYDAGRA